MKARAVAGAGTTKKTAYYATPDLTYARQRAAESSAKTSNGMEI